MLLLEKILAILGLLYIAVQAAEVQTFNSSYSESWVPSYLKVSDNIDHGLLYIMCDHPRASNFNCSLRLQMVNSDPKSCSFTISLPENQVLGYGFFSSSKLQKMIAGNTAVFEWTLYSLVIREYRWISLVDMDNCKFLHLQFPLNIKPRDKLHHKKKKSNYHLFLHDDCFYVLVESRAKCGKRRSPCMLQYNHRGELVSNITISSKYFEEGHSMVVDRSNSSSGAYLATFDRRGGHGFMNLSHLSCNGSETVLFTNYFIERDYMINHALQSNEHGNFSFCHPHDRTSNLVHCLQYILEDRTMMNITVVLEKKRKLLKVFNERDGGILLVYYDRGQVKIKSVRNDREISTTSVKLTKVEGLYQDFVEEGERLSINHFETDTEHCFYFAYAKQLSMTIESKYFSKCLNKTDIGS